MKKLRSYCLLVISASLLLSGCDTTFDEIKYSDGNANISRYVAIGGGYTAGYCDSALYLEAQRNSFPAILASRFALAEGGPFVQPLVNPGAGIGLNGNARYQFALKESACGSGSFLTPVPVSAAGDASNLTWLGSASTYNNMGVPGTRASNLFMQSFGDPSPFVGNQFYARFATNPGVSTISGDVLAQAPTFYTLWLGMEDIYGYARRGGRESSDSITGVSSFIASISSMINGLQAVGAQGVMANLPSPSVIPFFSANVTRGLVLSQEEADTLNVLYAPINPAITFQSGNNYYVISDNNAPGGRRQLTSGEYLLLSVPMDSLRCYSWGRLVPIPGRYILDAQEVALVNTAVTDYNTALNTLAQQEGIPVVSINSFFTTLSTSPALSGPEFSISYPFGGFFSTDGFYPTPRGYALIANRFVEVINAVYEAKIPMADVNAYPGIKFP
jgi:hypothetical protein